MPESDAQQTQRVLYEQSQRLAGTTEGVVVTVDYTERTCEVDMGGILQEMRWAGPTPWTGSRVRVVSAGGSTIAMMVYGSQVCTITKLDGSFLVVVDALGNEYRYPFVAATTAYAVGNLVLADHGAQCVLGKYSAAPEGSPEFPGGGGVAPAPPKPPSQTIKREFRPTGAYNWYYGGGRWEAGAQISDNRAGYFFYGRQIGDTIPNNATILSAYISLGESWDNVPGVASAMGHHGYAARPGSPPGLSGSIGVTGPGAYNIGAWATAFRNGTAYGVGFARGTGWRQLTGGTISITWRTA